MLPVSIFVITPYVITLSLVGFPALFILGPSLLPSDPPREEPGQTDDTSEYLTELSTRPDSAAVGKPLKSVGSLKKRLKKIRGVSRAGELFRTGFEDMEWRAGDRIILKSSPVDVLTLRRSRDFDIGISRTSTPLPEEHDVVETMISPSDRKSVVEGKRVSVRVDLGG